MFLQTRRFAAGLSAEYLCKCLEERGTKTFFGVHDGMFKGLTSYLNSSAEQHYLCSNEGNAVAMAAGHFIATGAIPCVYFPNTGLGNAANPFLTLTHQDADKMPMIVFVGWRGTPESLDYPQYEMLGRNTQNLLTVMGQPYSILPTSENPEFCLEMILDKAYSHFTSSRSPFIVLAEKEAFDNEVALPSVITDSISRQEAVESVLSMIPEEDAIVVGPGGLVKEVALARKKGSAPHKHEYISIGARDHFASVAEGIAVACGGKNVFCLESGTCVFPSNFFTSRAKNMKRVFFNEATHVDLLPVAEKLGYNTCGSVKTSNGIRDGMEKLIHSPSSLLQISVKKIENGEKEVVNYNGGKMTSFFQQESSKA